MPAALRILGAACAALTVLALAPTAVASADEEICLFCHEDLENEERQRVAAELDLFPESVHGELGLACGDCHTDVAGLDGDHPEELAPAACSDCHEAAEEIAASSHEALSCEDCHGNGHKIAPTKEGSSATSHFRVSQLCTSCHEVLGEQASQYEDGIHGRAVTRAGLAGAPSCLTCHGAHDIHPAEDPRSRVHRTKVVDMCGSCHAGLLPTYSESVHAGLDEETGEPRAVCSNCHSTHAVGSRNQPAWRAAVVAECGECHGELLESFRDGFHGQATLLGFERVAKCSDCHGFHDILEIEDPRSRVADGRVVETCRTCHERATANWADYDPHQDLSSAERNPQAYWAKLSMSGLLAGVFSFFFLHTALWLPRAVLATRSAKKQSAVGGAAKREGEADATLKIRRFDVFDRTLHIALMVSFLGLALSGLPLLFADRPWAPTVAAFFGGYGVSGSLHRLSAVLMFATFFIHVGRVTLRALRSSGSILWGPDSLVPMPRDVVQLGQHVRWFLGRGPYPKFDRYTYWEKFDYWAVFWGMAIIGFSGLVMWFPGIFLSFLPGWTLNVALVVHSEEALLAMVFIFTVHFFNGHLRPGKFPMDPVIFTGEVSAEELRHERPAEYERLQRSGRLVASDSKSPRWLVKGGPILGTIAVVIGWIIVFITVWSFLTH